MVHLENYEYMFLSSFLFAEWCELEEWKKLSQMANNLPLEFFEKNKPQYLLMRLLKKLERDNNGILPTTGDVISYIEELENKQLQDLLNIAFIEAGQRAPAPVEVLELYLPTFEQKVLLKQTKEIV